MAKHTPTYKGPSHLSEDMDVAVAVLASSLTATASHHGSHTYLRIAGFGSRSTLIATAIYLVGSVAQCIQSDLKIREALFDDGTRNADLLADVIGVIGNASADQTFKTMSRDPWIWEAISHLIVHLSLAKNGFHPSGRVLVKTQVKYDVNDHGLDLIAIYDAGVLGITAGESKAYFHRPARAIADAATRLSEVDQNRRDPDIRATVNQLRPALTLAQRKKLGGAFWRSERTYYPFVCCDDNAALDWTRQRVVLDRLKIPADKKLLVPLSIPNVRDVFDSISSLMRKYVAGTLT